jgi:hypothetical protein
MSASLRKEATTMAMGVTAIPKYERFFRANFRDTIEYWDLPITKGLQERIHGFEHLDRDIGLEPLLAELIAHQQLDVMLSEETEGRLPSVAGGLGIAHGRSFKVIDPKLANPSGEHWERTFTLFELLL